MNNAMHAVYLLLYNHDDNGDVVSVHGVYATLDGAKRAAHVEYIDHMEDDNAAPLEWNAPKGWRGEHYRAYYGRHSERYFHISRFEVEA